MASSLFAIMRRLPAGETPPTGARVVYFDRGANRVLDSRPWMTMGRTIESYVVFPDTPMPESWVIRLTARTRRSADPESVTFYLSYTATCPAGAEKDAIHALAADGSDLAASLERRLQRYFQSFVDGRQESGKDFVAGFFELRPALVARLIERSREEVGLSLRLELQMNGEAAAEHNRTVTVETSAFVVRVGGYDRDISVRVRGPLSLAERHPGKVWAILQAAKAQGPDDVAAHLARVVEERARKFLIDTVSIEDFSGDGAAHGVEDRLKQHLNEALGASEGRVFDYLTLELPDLPTLPPARVSFRHAVDVHVRDAADKVTVEHTVALALDNLARFQAARQRDADLADVEAWFRRQLEPIAQDALFNYSYSDLILRLKEDDIRGPLAAKAAEIGYSIRQYVALPQQQILRLAREGVRLDEGDEALVTRDTRVTVALRAAVSAKLPEDLSRLEPYIRVEGDLEADIRRTVREAMADVVHVTTPARFYMEFTNAEGVDEQGRRRPSVEAELRDAIRAALEKRFGLRDIVTTPKMADNALTQRYAALCHGLHEMIVEVQSLADDGSQGPVPFVLQYKITGVTPDGWAIFQGNRYPTPTDETAALEAVIRESINTAFGLQAPQSIGYTGLQVWRQMVAIAGRMAMDKVAQAFGLSMTVVNFRRDRTADEDLAFLEHDAARRNRAQTLDNALDMEDLNRAHDIKDLDELRERQRRLIASGNPDPEEMDNLNRAVERLRAGSRTLFDRPAASARPAPPPQDDSVDLDAFAQVATLVDPVGSLSARKEPPPVSGPAQDDQSKA